MLTEDYLEKITVYSEAVQVTVRDYTGRLRVFNLDHAKVILRYHPSDCFYAYNPSNISKSSSFRPREGDWLELVIATEGLITLESED